MFYSLLKFHISVDSHIPLFTNSTIDLSTSLIEITPPDEPETPSLNHPTTSTTDPDHLNHSDTSSTDSALSPEPSALDILIFKRASNNGQSN